MIEARLNILSSLRLLELMEQSKSCVQLIVLSSVTINVAQQMCSCMAVEYLCRYNVTWHGECRVLHFYLQLKRENKAAEMVVIQRRYSPYL